jgi:hypothetical protein
MRRQALPSNVVALDMLPVTAPVVAESPMPAHTNLYLGPAGVCARSCRDLAALWDTQTQGFWCAGPTEHGYDMFKHLEQQPDAINEPVQVWDDEVWVAVDIGPVGDDEGMREVLARAVAANPPRMATR